MGKKMAKLIKTTMTLNITGKKLDKNLRKICLRRGLRVKNLHWAVLPPRGPKLRKRSLKAKSTRRLLLALRNIHPNQTIVTKGNSDAAVSRNRITKTENSAKTLKEVQEDRKDLEDPETVDTKELGDPETVDRKELGDPETVDLEVAKSPALKQDLKVVERKLLVNKLRTIKFETTFINK